MDKTRIIYRTQPSSLQITNNKEYPVLIQAGVWDEDNKKSTHFIATPPIFKMESSDKNIIRVVNIKKDFLSDRETLSWLCVESMPPVEKNTGIKRGNRTENISISIRGCIKLIYRPESVSDPDYSEIAKFIAWKKGNGQITVTNTSPYYINFGAVKFDNTPMPEILYIKPFSKESYHTNARNISEVSWSMINDIGVKTIMNNTKLQ